MALRKEMDFKQYRLYNVGPLEMAKGVKFNVVTAEGNLALNWSHHWVFVGGNFTISLPNASGVHTGREYYIKNTRPSDPITMQVNGNPTTIPAGSTLHLISDGTKWQII